MDPLVETRLKHMRRTIQSRDNDCRRISLNDWRREKRHTIVNVNRGIDFEWLNVESEDEVDSGSGVLMATDITSLGQYLIGPLHMDEMIATKCLQNIKMFVRNNYESEEVICAQLVTTLSIFLAKPLNSNQMRGAALDIIGEIIKDVDITHYEELIAQSGLVLSVMVNFDTNHIEVLTKVVFVMRGLIRNCRTLLVQALGNGYLLFLMNIIKSTYVFRQRKYTETSQSERLLQKKVNLIREVSESLVSAAIAGLKPDRNLIQDLYSMLEKLIHFKDNKTVDNAVMSLNILVEQNPESLSLLNRHLILSLTDLLSKNNENISSNVVHFWKQLNQRIDTNIVNFFINLLIETNLIKKLVHIVLNIESKGLNKDVIIFLSEFIDKFGSSFELMVEFDVYLSLLRLLVRSDSLNRVLVLTTIKLLLDHFATRELLIHLFQIGIIETLVHIRANDSNLSSDCFRTLIKIQLKSEELNLKDEFFMRAHGFNLSLISISDNSLIESCCKSKEF